MMERGILIYNPVAHGGKLAEKVVRLAAEIYRAKGKELCLYAIDTAAGGFPGLKEKIGSWNPDHVIIAGGDGTVNRYVNFARDEGIGLPVGIVPAGTANDFALAAGVRPTVEGALLQIAEGRTCARDLGLIRSEDGEQCFINVFCSGYLTCVSHTTPDRLKKICGKLAYILHGAMQALTPKRRQMTVSCDGQRYEGKTLLVLVMNGKTTGQIEFARDASVTDGELDVIIFTGRTFFGTLKAALRTFLRLRFKDSADAIRFKGSHINIEGENHETDADGDKGPDYPVYIECLKGNLALLA